MKFWKEFAYIMIFLAVVAVACFITASLISAEAFGEDISTWEGEECCDRGQRCLVGFVECLDGPLVRHYADDPDHCAALYTMDGWPETWVEGATVDLYDYAILQNNMAATHSHLLWLGECN